MKREMIFALLVLGLLFVAPATMAEDPTPNLEGEWTVYIEEMCIPDGYGSGQGTLVITNQIGGAFEGHTAPDPDDITGAVARRTVRFSDVDYRGGFIDDMTIFTGELYGPHRIVGTLFHWDIDESEGSCTGYFEAVRDPRTAR